MNTMLLRNFFVGLISAVFLAANANAAVIFELVADPATTANNGIDAVSGMTVTSTQSGAGRYHLYALDNTDGSIGLANYSVGLVGAATILHRSPVSTVQDASENNLPSGFQLGRTLNGITPIQASQNPADFSAFFIDGVGRTTGNFATSSTSVDPASIIVGPTTSGQWGNYATDPALNGGLNWVLIAEGTYTGVVPTFNLQLTTAQVFGPGHVFMSADVCIGASACLDGGPTNTPPAVDSAVYPGYNNNLPGDPQTLVHQFAANDAEDGAGPFAWDDLQLLSYTPNYDGVGPGPLLGASLTAGGEFSWVSEGSPRGDYVWQVRATDSGGLTGLGTITVNATGVPEPTTLALFGIAMVGAIGFVRRRNG